MIEVEKDSKGEALHCIRYNGVPYTALDVAYTIAQNYRYVSVSATVYIGSMFPNNTVIMELNNLELPLTKPGFYFDADGIFLFYGDSEPNPDRAVSEFVSLADLRGIIMAPTLTKFEMEADEIICKPSISGRNTIYVYKEL